MGVSETLVPVLTPHGRFLFAQESDAPALAPELALRLRESYARGAGYGMLGLGAVEVAAMLPAGFDSGVVIEVRSRHRQRPTCHATPAVFSKKPPAIPPSDNSRIEPRPPAAGCCAADWRAP